MRFWNSVFSFVIWSILLAISIGLSTGAVSATAADGVVEVVLYWEPGCEACEDTLDWLMPFQEKNYPGKLEVNMVALTTIEDFDTLYRIGEIYGLAKNQVGVPLLLIGEEVLVGSGQIQDDLPDLVEMHLESGGIRTQVPELALQTQPVFQTEEPLWSGMPLAWILMVGMVLALGLVGWQLVRAFQGSAILQPRPWVNFSIPVLALVGLGISVYMTYIEATYTPAICGPVGDCNAVQNSPYAYLFGWLPVGLFGAGGYIALLAAWYWGQRQPDSWGHAAVLGMAVFGTLFSIYLTYLEIFVIRAVCIWCLSSALIITLLMAAGLPAAANWLAIGEEGEA